MVSISTSSAATRLALFNMQPGAIFDAREKQKDYEDISKESSAHISHRRLLMQPDKRAAPAHLSPI